MRIFPPRAAIDVTLPMFSIFTIIKLHFGCSVDHLIGLCRLFFLPAPRDIFSNDFKIKLGNRLA